MTDLSIHTKAFGARCGLGPLRAAMVDTAALDTPKTCGNLIPILVFHPDPSS